MSCQWLNKQESAPSAFFRYTGSNNVDYLGAVSHAPVGDDLLGRTYLHANDVLSTTITFKPSTYNWSSNNVAIYYNGGAVDTTNNTLFMPILNNMTGQPNMEAISLADTTQRRIISTNNTFFASGKLAMPGMYQTTNILYSGSKRYLGVSEMYVNADQPKSGLKLTDITNGADLTNVWPSAVLQLADPAPTATPTVVFRAFHLYLPIVVNESRH